MKAMHHSRGSLTRLAQDRQKWKDFVAALDITGLMMIYISPRHGS